MFIELSHLLVNHELKIFIKDVSNHLFHTSIFNCKKIRFSFVEADNCFLTEVLVQIGYEGILKDNKHNLKSFVIYFRLCKYSILGDYT